MADTLAVPLSPEDRASVMAVLPSLREVVGVPVACQMLSDWVHEYEATVTALLARVERAEKNTEVEEEDAWRAANVLRGEALHVENGEILVSDPVAYMASVRRVAAALDASATAAHQSTGEGSSAAQPARLGGEPL